MEFIEDISMISNGCEELVKRGEEFVNFAGEPTTAAKAMPIVSDLGSIPIFWAMLIPIWMIIAVTAAPHQGIII